MEHTTTTTEGPAVTRPPDAPLVRPREGRVVAGVALAVADRLGMSPTAVRIVWFVLGWVGGLGILLYLAGWLLIPEEGAERSIAEDLLGRSGDAATWIGVALIAIAGIALLDAGDIVNTDVAWAVGLLVLGILVFRGDIGGARPTEDEAVTPAGVDEATPPGIDEVTTVATAPVRVPRPPRVRRERSILGRLAFGTILVVLGGMLALDTAGAIEPSPTTYLAVVTGIVGAALLLGAFVGRSRGLIFLGLMLLPFLLAFSVVTARFAGGWGDPDYTPATIAEVQASYSLTGGEMTIDLGAVDLAGGTVSFEGDVGFGRLLVLIPEGAGYTLDAHVGFGEIAVVGQHQGGIDVDRTLVHAGTGSIVMDLDVGFGQIEIMEVSR